MTPIIDNNLRARVQYVFSQSNELLQRLLNLYQSITLQSFLSAPWVKPVLVSNEDLAGSKAEPISIKQTYTLLDVYSVCLDYLWSEMYLAFACHRQR